jgi:hypothetical protein
MYIDGDNGTIDHVLSNNDQSDVYQPISSFNCETKPIFP